MESNFKNIHEAILGVYAKVGYVQKTGKVEFGATKYKFAGEAEFIASIRPALIECGIEVSPHSQEVLTNELIGFANGKQQFRVVIKSVYRFTHAESNTSKDVPAFGEAMDSGDKAFNKAMTAAQKYALRQTFLIETGDDPDKYASLDDGGVQYVFKTKRERTALFEKIRDELEQADSIEALNDIINGSRKIDLLNIKHSDYGETIYDNLIEIAGKQKQLFVSMKTE
jgi:hypothetical protein